FIFTLENLGNSVDNPHDTVGRLFFLVNTHSAALTAGTPPEQKPALQAAVARINQLFQVSFVRPETFELIATAKLSMSAANQLKAQARETLNALQNNLMDGFIVEVMGNVKILDPAATSQSVETAKRIYFAFLDLTSGLSLSDNEKLSAFKSAFEARLAQ